MDTLTHALAGALIGRATAPRQPREGALPVGPRMLAGFLTAAFPDVDFITGYLTPLAYLHHHRGITHSILLMPLWAVLLAAILALLWRGRYPWRAFVGIAVLGIASHIALDLITAFGTMVFAPFSDARYALSATFIIDPWFTGILVAGLLACAAWRASRVPAAAALSVLACYVAFQCVVRQQAIDFGEREASAIGWRGAKVSAVPRPVSPFNWTVVIEHDDRYRYANVNLLRQAVRPEPGPRTGFFATLDAPYRPLDDAAWLDAAIYSGAGKDAALAREAYSDPGFRFFRWFAAYPALLKVEAGNPERCAWFYDLRFDTPGRGATPFRYGMCREGDGPWKPFQLVGEQRKAVY